MKDNRYAKELIQTILQRYSRDSLTMTNAEWICQNTSKARRPFSFEKHEYQIDIVNDLHPNLSVIKPSQVGLTEIQIRKALAFLLRNVGTSLIFSIADVNMQERLSKTRIKPIIDTDPVFKTPNDIANKSTRTSEIYQFDQSFLYLVIANLSAATSTPADFIMNDEIDSSDQRALGLFTSRLSASNYQIIQRFSTPTVPGYGIDESWQGSDQKVYLCKCSSCGHYNNPEFTRKFIYAPNLPDMIPLLTDIPSEYASEIDISQSYVKCEKCHSRLDIGNPAMREWVATYPSRSYSRGYQVTPFCVERLNPKYIFSRLWGGSKLEKKDFFNTVLGVPYTDENTQIPLESILQSFTSNSNTIDLTGIPNLFMGIDMGLTCHVVIGKIDDSNKGEILAFHAIPVGEIESFVVSLVNKYNILAGCIDRFPYTPTSDAICKATNYKILPLEYRGLKNVNIIRNSFGTIDHAQANHTYFLDKVYSWVRKGALKISGYTYNKDLIIQHYRDMVREPDSETKVIKWKKLSGNDHYLHATGFFLIAPEVFDLYNYSSGTETRTSFYVGGLEMPENKNRIF